MYLLLKAQQLNYQKPVSVTINHGINQLARLKQIIYTT